MFRRKKRLDPLVVNHSYKPYKPVEDYTSEEIQAEQQWRHDHTAPLKPAVTEMDVTSAHPEDVVNHPSHYTDGKIEVADFIADKNFNHFRGSAIKYIARAGKKDPSKEVEDLQKAIWYLQRELHRIGAYAGVPKHPLEGVKVVVPDGVMPSDFLAQVEEIFNGVFEEGMDAQAIVDNISMDLHSLREYTAAKESKE